MYDAQICIQTGSAPSLHFTQRTESSQDYTSDQVSIEKRNSKVLYGGVFHKSANRAILAAKRRLCGQLDKKFSGCDAYEIERFFPYSKVEVQSAL